jgi:hypothetical protein
VVAPTAAERGYIPAASPQVAVASDGTLAAVQDGARVAVVEVPGCAAFAEIGIDGEAESSDIAWVGAPPRLLVASRYAGHTQIHLVDPYGPRAIADLRLEALAHVRAAAGGHALLVSPQGAGLISVGESHLSTHQLPSRTVPVAAGAAAGQFIVAVAGTLEEWEPQSRMPRRRFKLPRHVSITAVGGSDRVLWFTTQQDPERIEVIPVVNRGQPRAHTLPEPIGRIAAHPRSDVIACTGAETGRLWVIDLDGRMGLRMIGPAGIERVEAIGLVVGRVTGVLAAQTGRPLAVISLDSSGAGSSMVAAPASAAASTSAATASRASRPELTPEPEAMVGSSLFGEPDDAGPPTAVTLASPPGAGAPASEPGSLAERIARIRSGGTASVAPAGPAAALAPSEAVATATWRDDVVAWATAHVAGDPASDPPDAAPIRDMAGRLRLPAQLDPALALLYGMHLAGQPGAAPVHIARVLRGAWHEALGRGELAARGAATFTDSRVRLAPELVRALDELPPRTGILVGRPGTQALSGPRVVVSRVPLSIAAETCLAAVGGAILAAYDHPDPGALLREARAYGAVPLVRASELAGHPVENDEPLLLAVDDEASATLLALPRLR